MYYIKRYTSPNFEGRKTFKPIMIVNHITDGENAVRNDDNHENTAVYNTFMNPACKASSHFVILRDGAIWQFVDIINAAWTQGLRVDSDFDKSTSSIVRTMRVNPNLYCISKEYIGYAGAGGDGNITEEQFWAGVWLDKYIQEEVKKKWGHKIPLNSTYEIGHFQIDPVNKPLCPGRNFPWSRVYQELAIADTMSLDDFEGRLQYLKSDKYKITKAYAIANEVLYLHDLTQGTDGNAKWARNILLNMHPVMTDLKLLDKPFDPEESHNHIKNQIIYLYNMKDNNDGNTAWAREQLLKLYPYMLQNGLVPA